MMEESYFKRIFVNKGLASYESDWDFIAMGTLKDTKKDIRTWQETIISMDSDAVWTVKQVKGVHILAMRYMEGDQEITVPVEDIERLIRRWREKVGA